MQQRPAVHETAEIVADEVRQPLSSYGSARAGAVWRDDQIWGIPKGSILRQGFRVGDLDAGSGNCAGSQRRVQCTRVNNSAPCNIDQHRILLARAELPVAEKMVRRLIIRRGD